MTGIRKTEEQIASASFGEALHQLRLERGLSVARLAELTHYSRGHLNNVEHGIKAPSVELAAACDQVLDANGRLQALMPVRRRAERRPAVRPAQLPAAPGNFVGRAGELHQLDTLLAPSAAQLAVAVVHGPPGVGKSVLALRWAHDHRHVFTDGQLFADLRGHARAQVTAASPEEILEGFLVALGLAASEVPATLEERAALFRSLTDGRRILIFLDDAASSAQVRPLLPGTPTCVVLVTTRTHLAGLAVRQGAHQLQLSPFAPAESLALLQKITGERRVEADRRVAETVVDRCGHLPLAVALAAERIAAHPRLTLAELACELDEEHARLSALSAVDDEQTALRAVYSWSYRALTSEAARMFRLLGLHPGRDISAAAAAGLAGLCLDDARSQLRALATGHLVEETRHDRFAMHDLLRLYAAEQVEVEEPVTVREAATVREATWYLNTAQAANRLLAPHEQTSGSEEAEVQTRPFHDYDSALSWCEAELLNVIATVRFAVKHGCDDLAWQLPSALFTFFHLRKPWSLWETTYRLGLTAAHRAGDAHGEAEMLQGLGLVSLGLQQYDEALDRFHHALSVSQASGNQSDEAWALTGLGLVRNNLRLYDEARSHFEDALTIRRQTGDCYGQAVTLIYLADAWREQGHLDEALDCSRQALAIFRATSDAHGEGLALYQLGECHAAAAELTEAIACFKQALPVHRAAGDRKGEADTLWALSKALLRQGDHAPARNHLQEALEIFEERGDPAGLDVRARLDYLDDTSAPKAPDDAPVRAPE
nr:tetratricopeptide repeat protein [Amycolatopsis rhizosphaerae]